MGRRAGMDGCGKSRATGTRSPYRPACSMSLYRLRYPGRRTNNTTEDSLKKAIIIAFFRLSPWLTLIIIRVSQGEPSHALNRLTCKSRQPQSRRYYSTVKTVTCSFSWCWEKVAALPTAAANNGRKWTCVRKDVKILCYQFIPQPT